MEVLVFTLFFLMGYTTLAISDGVDCADCRNTLTGATGGFPYISRIAGWGSKKMTAKQMKFYCGNLARQVPYKYLKEAVSEDGHSVVKFMLQADCHTSLDNSVPRHLPYQLMILDGIAHVSNAIEMMAEYRKKPGGREILDAIFNRTDKKGRTMLDFLEERYGYYTENNYHGHAKKLVRLRKMMCLHGAKYRKTAQQNRKRCQIKESLFAR